MDKKEFVPYEIALELKKLYFDELCLACYNADLKDKNLIYVFEQENSLLTKNSYFYNISDSICTAPLWQQAFKWFRETHKLYISSHPEFYTTGINFNWQILWYLPKEKWVYDENNNPYNINDGTFSYGDNGEYPSQEDADFAIIKKMIEIVKKEIKLRNKT